MKLKSLPISPAVKDALYAVFHGRDPDENLDPEVVGDFDLCAGRGTDTFLGSPRDYAYEENTHDDTSACGDIITTSNTELPIVQKQRAV